MKKIARPRSWPLSWPRPWPRPQPRPYPKTPRPADMRIQPKPMAKIYNLFKDIERRVKRFIARFKAEFPVALLLAFGVVAAVASTFCTWNDRVQTIMVNSSHPGDKIVLIADDMFGCQSSRSELMELCNSGTCIVVIPSSGRWNTLFSFTNAKPIL